MRARYPLYLANAPVYTAQTLTVTSKYTGEPVTEVALADADTIDAAIAAAVEARGAMAALPAWRRQAILMRVVERLEADQEALAQILCVEAGKPIKDARVEVLRAIDTFRIAAEEAVRIYGEYQPLDISPRAEGYEAIWRRVPIGAVSFISPFNFPLNLAAHKIAPAIAAGCPFVLKPASLTPVGALMIAEILADAGLPKGAFSVLPADRAAATAFTEDPRLKLLSFTGSPEVGWDLKRRAGQKKVVLELGGNAACIVDKGVDLERAAARITAGAFYQSGQSCISVQRVLIHREIYADLLPRLVERARALVMGDPRQEDTFIGPMITLKDAERVATWVDEAVAEGGRVLCGGAQAGRFYPPTIVEGAPKHTRLQREEVFGPVFCVEPYDDFAVACQIVNDSDYGLQAGVFTADVHKSFYAFKHLEVGGVIINDVPSMRVDSMPYGGVKASGLGREGLRFAIEDMTEIRLMVLSHVGEAVD
ncbi:aldehyde dehydrogenase family protein [Myxococcota bacterium]|nr:aldehyde dehydrogenase family protein [Myxococcota bacterium]MBU1432364.1 aldehyde dehydrogenase family protein [Myxococcota bacterium]MBU1899432.1 aldehyde dehydrogenase family protein [Myxococcota bacterium]